MLCFHQRDTGFVARGFDSESYHDPNIHPYGAMGRTRRAASATEAILGVAIAPLVPTGDIERGTEQDSVHIYLQLTRHFWPSVLNMHKQSLSFTVRIARTPRELHAACRVRALSYGHHLPHLHATLSEPDLLDVDENTVVVLCVDKESGSAVGTARFQTNAGGLLLIEHSVTVPEAMRNDTRAEITRLSAVAGADPLVKLCLMKASYLFCMATQVRWMVIGARNEALVRQYRRLGFRDLFDDGRMVPLLHAGRLEHRVLSFNVTAAERTWREPRHPLYEFIFETAHPDIELFSTRPALPHRESSRRTAHAPSWPMAREGEPAVRSASGRASALVN